MKYKTEKVIKLHLSVQFYVLQHRTQYTDGNELLTDMGIRQISAENLQNGYFTGEDFIFI